jgi:hypothetical protein
MPKGAYDIFAMAINCLELIDNKIKLEKNDTKDLLCKKKTPKFARFLRFFFFPKSPDNFKECSQEYGRILYFIFLLSYLVYSQIWLNCFLDDHHFGYITKSLKETLVWVKQKLAFLTQCKQ